MKIVIILFLYFSGAFNYDLYCNIIKNDGKLGKIKRIINALFWPVFLIIELFVYFKEKRREK